MERLGSLLVETRAKDLYMGRGFKLGANAATSSGARLYVISAGLGLVNAERQVPSYDVTVGAHGPDAIRARSLDAFDPQRWWSALRGTTFSIDWEEAFHGDGPVLIALTRAYAEMILGDLVSLPDADKARLRLFGLGLPSLLPPTLAKCVMPYDERLDRIVRGTRTDFAQRALSHFVHSVPCRDIDTDAAAVLSILGEHAPPARADRPRMTDDDIVRAIAGHLQTVKGIGRILRRLRDEDGIACEQKRFTRLYHRAVAQVGAA